MAGMSPVMTVMIRAAEKAARTLVRDFGEVEQLQVSRKGPSDFVSAADHRAEETIFRELQKARPDFEFLMEERGNVKGKSTDVPKWIVDPLDGTTNFLHGVPHWCISIGLEDKGEIVAGVVYDPTKNEMFRAEKGTGAYVGNRRLRVSGRSDLMEAVIASGKPRVHKDDPELFFKEYKAVAAVAPGLRRFGAAALDMCYVAAGRCEAFWERTLAPWDIAAGTLIVREAGGFVTPIHGNDNPVYSISLIAGNGPVHGKLREILQSVK